MIKHRRQFLVSSVRRSPLKFAEILESDLYANLNVQFSSIYVQNLGGSPFMKLQFLDFLAQNGLVSKISSHLVSENEAFHNRFTYFYQARKTIRQNRQFRKGVGNSSHDVKFASPKQE